jgi:hypothetical protein
MTMTGRWRGWFVVVLVGAIAVGAPPYVSAQQSTASADALPDAKPNTGRISLSLGVDWVSEYFFRGIAQQVGGVNFQPYASVSFKLVENAGPLTALTATPGIWNHWHAGGGNFVEPVDPEFWYEADLTFALAATLTDTITLGLTYTAYTSPNDSFATVQELAFGVSLNDSKWLAPFALNPSLLVAGELTGQADAGSARGVYVQLGINPGYTLAPESAYPLTISFPVILGLSAHKYYEFATTNNPAFGYVQFGPVFSVALGFMPKSFGTWTFKGAAEFLFLGERRRRPPPVSQASSKPHVLFTAPEIYVARQKNFLVVCKPLQRRKGAGRHENMACRQGRYQSSGRNRYRPRLAPGLPRGFPFAARGRELATKRF